DPVFITVLKSEFKLDEWFIKYQIIKLSDSADPDALKQQSEAVKEEVGEQTKEKEGEEAKENDVEESETPSETISKEEGENGVQ
ncbi:MAG: hypothetical protein JRH09_18895, partial [Deltaproteobacteria bacterium]|nr:hypothetical protein [Deltaproteobacteria bacterium]